MTYYRMQNPEAVNMLEHLATSLNFMTPELEQYIAQQREYLRPRTPQELRHEFDRLRRHRHSENECARGMDDYNADQQEELRKHLIKNYPDLMGDYIQEFGHMEFAGPQSDVWNYTFPYEDIELFFEVWLEYIEQGVIVRCRLLPLGDVVTLRCGTSYEVGA
jgi:hypothetical protein